MRSAQVLEPEWILPQWMLPQWMLTAREGSNKRSQDNDKQLAAVSTGALIHGLKQEKEGVSLFTVRVSARSAAKLIKFSTKLYKINMFTQKIVSFATYGQ